MARVWYLLELPPPVGSYFGPAGPPRVRRGCKVSRYVNLDTGLVYLLIERPALGPPRWVASEDPSA